MHPYLNPNLTLKLSIVQIVGSSSEVERRSGKEVLFGGEAVVNLQMDGRSNGGNFLQTVGFYLHRYRNQNRKPLASDVVEGLDIQKGDYAVRKVSDDSVVVGVRKFTLDAILDSKLASCMNYGAKDLCCVLKLYLRTVNCSQQRAAGIKLVKLIITCCLKMATGINMLPEDCISTILSLTSPPDAYRSTLVSSSLRSAAESDTVWGRFLPSDLPRILSRSHTELNFSSKKELFFQLCGSILIDGGLRSFSLAKVNGKKSCVISARALSISLSDEPNHWIWTSNSTSRFQEVIELKAISNMEIEGTIHTEDLSRNTTYVAYLVTKISQHSFGLDSIPCETLISNSSSSVSNTTYLCPLDEQKQQLESLFFMNRR